MENFMKKLLLLALTIASGFNAIGAWPSIFNRNSFNAQEGTLINYEKNKYLVVDRNELDKNVVKFSLQPTDQNTKTGPIEIAVDNKGITCGEQTFNYYETTKRQFNRAVGSKYSILNRSFTLKEIIGEPADEMQLKYDNDSFFGKTVFSAHYKPGQPIVHQRKFEWNYKRCALTGLATFGAIFGVYHYAQKK
jgi:hypothetical protein